jgi:hypothetical protein
MSSLASSGHPLLLKAEAHTTSYAKFPVVEKAVYLKNY